MRSQSEGCFELHQGSWIASVAKLQHIAYMSRAMSLSWQYSDVYSEWGVGIYSCPSPSLSHVQVSQSNYYQVAVKKQPGRYLHYINLTIILTHMMYSSHNSPVLGC